MKAAGKSLFGRWIGKGLEKKDQAVSVPKAAQVALAAQAVRAALCTAGKMKKGIDKVLRMPYDDKRRTFVLVFVLVKEKENGERREIKSVGCGDRAS